MPHISSDFRESKIQEELFLDNDSTPGIYDTKSKTVTGWIDADPAPLGTILKCCKGGVVLFSVFTDRTEMHWRDKTMLNPVIVMITDCRARSFQGSPGGSWRAFNYDWVSNADITRSTYVAHEHYSIIEEVLPTAFFGIEYWFTKGRMEQNLFAYRQGYDIQIEYDIAIRRDALKSNRNNGTGMPTPGDIAGVTPTFTANSPNTNFDKWTYIFQRGSNCPAMDGRTPMEIANDGDGLFI